MIRVQRGPEPASLRRHARAWTNELCAERAAYYVQLERFEQGEIKTAPKFPNARKTRYGTDSVKNALRGMFGAKCCYCEGSVQGTSYQQVEHFRPQSIYPSLAYRWTNLLYACEQCNCGFKKDLFPLAQGERRAEADRTAPCKMDDSDAAILVDPCREDPTDFFTYKFSSPNSNGPIDVTLVCHNRRAQLTRDVCGLDRDDLNDARRAHLSNVMVAIKLFLLSKERRNEEMHALAKAKLQEFVSASAPYSAMSRAYLSTMTGVDLIQTQATSQE